MYCDVCGEEIEQGMDFCPFCGNSIEKESSNHTSKSENTKRLKRVKIGNSPGLYKKIVLAVDKLGIKRVKTVIYSLLTLLAIYILGALFVYAFYPPSDLKNNSFSMTDSYKSYGDRRFALIMENKKTGACYELFDVFIADDPPTYYGEQHTYNGRMNPDGEMDPGWALSDGSLVPFANWKDLYIKPEGYSLDELSPTIGQVRSDFIEKSIERFRNSHKEGQACNVKLEIGFPNGTVDVKYISLQDYLNRLQTECLPGIATDVLNKIVSEYDESDDSIFSIRLKPFAGDSNVDELIEKPWTDYSSGSRMKYYIYYGYNADGTSDLPEKLYGENALRKKKRDYSLDI